MRLSIILFLSFLALSLSGQVKPELTVEKIMQDPKSWVGSSPSGAYWSEDGKTLYFDWNPEMNPADSLYKISAPWNTPVKVSMTEQAEQRRSIVKMPISISMI